MVKISSVMIIDDSDADQFLTEAIIKKTFLSIEIHQAYDGEEALETLDSMDKQPSLILLDINMPGMNGLELLDRLHPPAGSAQSRPE